MRRLIPLLFLLLCAACGQQTGIGDAVALALPPSTQTPAHADTVTSYDTLLASLQASFNDLSVEDGITHQFLSVTGKLITLGSQRLQAFEYADDASAETEAKRFSRDGAWIDRDGTPTLVNWISTPHLYRSGKLLVVYVGDDATILEALNNTLGREFAGGANPYAVAMQVEP
jgi:hypothetical protein